MNTPDELEELSQRALGTLQDARIDGGIEQVIEIATTFMLGARHRELQMQRHLLDELAMMRAELANININLSYISQSRALIDPHGG